MNQDIVTLENVSKIYPMGETDVTALKDITMGIPKGSFAALVGPSGSGKTTVLNIIGCLDTPTTGEVKINGQSVGRLNRKQGAVFRGKHLGFVFQDFNLLPVLSVFENVEYPLLMIQDVPKRDRKSAVDKVLSAVGMVDQALKYPAQLSGGQKQRVAIARALVGNPVLVLADEPTANLDGKTAQTVVDLMKRMRDAFGTTFVFSTHDPRIMDQAELMFHLEDGCLLNTSFPVKEAPHGKNPATGI